MAASTIRYDLTAGAWTLIGSAPGDFLVQLRSPTPALVVLAEASPALNVDDYLVLGNGYDTSASFTPTSATAKIYARAGNGTNDGSAVVVAFGG